MPKFRRHNVEKSLRNDPFAAGLAQIDDLERRMVQASEEHTIALGGIALSEATRQQAVAHARAITDQLRADYRARRGPC